MGRCAHFGFNPQEISWRPMAKTPKEYIRLPGRGRRKGGFKMFVAARQIYSLWLGSDHLLLVERNGYSETYKRFYFADIQAFIMRKTASAKITTSVTAVLALLFSLWGLGVTNLPGRVTLWIMGGCFALFSLINLLQGPSCVMHIQTAVQREQIPSWGRVRVARKGLARIRQHLHDAQGVVSAEDLKTQWMAGLGQQPGPTAQTT
jgi:hypothetical protein